MEKQEKIQKLKEHLLYRNVNHEKEILNMNSLKDAIIYCIIHKLSSQKFGVYLEKYIGMKYNYQKNSSSNCIGDYNKNGMNYEFKVSLGGMNQDKFNFVQIRPFHNCNYYMFISFYLNDSNVELEGDLFIFKIPKSDINQLLFKFGSYAHGSKKQNGNITLIDLENKSNFKEYSIRTKFNDKCWKELLNYRIQPDEI
jgi:hypothetical protein